MQKKKKKIKKKKRKEKEKRRDYNIYKAVLCYNYIIDKAVWSSSPGLRCQSCCNEKYSATETTPLQINLYFIPCLMDK